MIQNEVSLKRKRRSRFIHSVIDNMCFRLVVP